MESDLKWVPYHIAIDLKRSGYRWTGKKKSVKGVDYVEVDLSMQQKGR